jgi:AraC family transcriptional regulator
MQAGALVGRVLVLRGSGRHLHTLDREYPGARVSMPSRFFQVPLFGSTVVRREIAGLTVSEDTYAPGLTLPEHIHRDPVLCLVLDGGHSRVDASSTVEHRPLTLSFLPADVKHRDQFDPALGARCLNVTLHAAWQARMAGVFPLPGKPHRFAGGPLSWLGIRLYEEFRTADDFSSLAIEGLVLEAMAGIARHGTALGAPDRAVPSWLRRAKELVERDFSRGLGLSDISREVGVHPVHLARSFRKHFKMTVGRCARSARVDFARDLLARSDQTVVSIALAAGFADQSHFCRTFTSHVGMTPSAFRARQRPKPLPPR